MKQFELKALGMEEMKSEELVKTEGGSLVALAAIALVGILAFVILLLLITNFENSVS